MEEGKVPPDLFSLSEEDSDTEKPASNTAENFVVSGGRLGGGGGSVDLATNVPDEDEAVKNAAHRFRRNKLGNVAISEKTLDEEDAGQGEISDDDLQGLMLDALDAEPEPPISEPIEESEVGDDTMRVDIEHTGRIEDAPAPKPAEQGVNCPHCSADNPPGMKFCVECGGSLAVTKKGGEEQKKKIPPASELAQKENPWKISLVSINEDGSDGVDIPLEFLETTIGRDGDTRFPTDAFLSPKHARLHIEKGDLYIEDLYSLNGTFLKLRDEVRLTPGDTFLMGRQVLRFERFEQAITPKTKSSDGTRYMGSPSPGGSYKVLQIGIGGIVQNVYCLPESGAVLGREKGDIIFPHDKFMSSRHAQIYTGDDGHCYLVDLNSSNGTWIKIWEKTKLHDSDFIFMGQQLFRIVSKGKK